LASSDFRKLISSYIVDSIGSWAYTVIVIVYVFGRTHSATSIAITTAASWAPRMLLTAYGGVLADRYERTRVMLVSALLGCVGMTALAFAVLKHAPIWLILALLVVNTSLSVAFEPASRALIPEVVGERALVAANALFSGLESLVVVVGPAIGGLMLVGSGSGQAQEHRVGGVIVLNGLSFLASALFIYNIDARSRGGAGAEGESTLRQLAAGFQALASDRVALVLVLYCALDSSVYAAATVLFGPLSARLDIGASGYSYLIAVFAVGGVLVAGIVNRISSSTRLAPVILAGMFALSLPFAAAATTDVAAVVFLLMVVAGGGMVIVDVLAITALQRNVPGEVMSRVFGIFLTIIPLALLGMSFLTAALLRAHGVRDTMLLVGVGVAAIAVVGIWPVIQADSRTAAALRALAPKVRMLESLDMFAGATRAVIERLAAAFQEVVVQADEVFIGEGEPADALFVIVDGTVDVSARDDSRGSHHLRTMSVGTYVGEIGLLHELPRTATVRAITETTLWRIEREDFFAAINDSGISSSMSSISRSRLSHSHARVTS
jgi:hypothetical protein